MAREQTEKSPRHSIGRHNGGVGELCQTRGHQGYFAATFQVRTNPQNFNKSVKARKNNKQTKSIGLIFNYPLFISPQHWHQHPNQEVQKVSQFQETRLLAGHLHGARLGTPPPRTRQQIQDWERPHRQDQPTGIRTEASISSRAQGLTENGAGQAEARVEHHRLSSRQTRGSPQTDMSGTLQEENGNKSEGGEQSQGGHLCSVPKFSKCLRLLPNVLQHSFV